MKIFIAAFFCILISKSFCQDTSIVFENRVFVMPLAVVRGNLNVPTFIKYVQKDTSFYKAFKNLKILEYNAINVITMKNKKEETIASLHSTTKQTRDKNCRSTEIINEETTGDFYTAKKKYNYYTAEMYAGLFFAIPKKCNEDNIVGTTEVTTKGVSGLDKHKQQLKMLFFNPGKKIKGIPFMGDKTAIFDDNLTPYYDNLIDYEFYQGKYCYKFTVIAKTTLSKSERSNLVIDEMTTWFNTVDFGIVGRNYTLSYKAGIYDFKVNMQVEMTTYKNLTVPNLIRYVGNWDIAFKKRERGVFTATLYDFKE
jgi:hypothetical protein